MINFKNSNFKRFIAIAAIALAGTFANTVAVTKASHETRCAETLYSNDFEKLPEGEPDAELVVLVKGVLIKSIDGNKVLEFPSEPSDGYGVIFGPDGKSLLSVSARFKGSSNGRRFPEFGLGLADTGGYKLMAVPAAGELQLLKGEDVKATIPYSWHSGLWTNLKLQVQQAGDGKWAVQGKAWEGKEEPKDWTVKFEETEEPPKGRPSVWGSPYASTPIDVDDLLVTPAE